jgi:hypothetical protein
MRWMGLLFIGILFASACEDPLDCGLQDTTDELWVRFHSKQTRNALTVDFDTIIATFDQVLVGIGSGGTSTLVLPLDMSVGMTEFRFETDSFHYYLQMNYSRQVYLPNSECGPAFRVYRLEPLTEAVDDMEAFAEVRVRVTELTKSLTPHVEIYF